jgi:serine protease AprX
MNGAKIGIWGGTRTKVAAVAATAAMLAMPLPATGGVTTRSALLTATGSTSLEALAESVTDLGGRVVQTLGLSDTLLVELPAGAGLPVGAAEIADVALKPSGVSRKSEEATVSTFRETIGAPADSNAGAGVKVALVDTGVADVAGLEHVTHLAVADVGEGDGAGHGTFLAGLIGGRGSAPGVAPGAELIDVKVAGATGETSLSKVLSGLEMVADQDVDVLNLSLSTESPLPPAADPLSLALERLWRRGVTVVVAAGNDGPDWGTVTSPGNDPVVLTVGAVDEGALDGDRTDDSVATFSSRGSKFAKDKPDLAAPGVSLVSSLAPGSDAETLAAWQQDGLTRASGTSMSAAVASGAAAVVLAENASLKPNGVKALLKDSAYRNDDLNQDDGAGAGGLDLGAALAAADSAPTNPRQGSGPKPRDNWGPDEGDDAAWDAFSAAWESGDFEAVQAAWAKLSWRTKQWAARSWSVAVMASSLGLSEEDWEARSWSARSWSMDEWLARSWSARSWSNSDWAARSWSARSWSARSWSARSWSEMAWEARSWSARSWSARSWSTQA